MPAGSLRPWTLHTGVGADTILGVAPTDQQIARALVHDAQLFLIASADGPSEHELALVRGLLDLAEKVLAGTATDADRAQAAEIVHPSTRDNYLQG